MIEKNKSNTLEILKFLPIIVFIFNPKIDIISLPNYWQGIRLDDLVILIYSIFFVLKINIKIYPTLIHPKMFGFNWIIFFPYMIFSIFIGKLFGLDHSVLLFLRYCEYIALIIILNQLDPTKEKVLLLFKLYIVVNLVVVLLQYFEIIGGLTSRSCLITPYSEHLRLHYPNFLNNCFDKDSIKSICFFNCGFDTMKNYTPPLAFIDNSNNTYRVPGITGGPWELTVNLSICFFAITVFEKDKKKLIPYLLMIILVMIIGQVRGAIFGFLAGSLFLLSDFKKTVQIFSILLLLLMFLYFFDVFDFKQIFESKFLLDYVQLLQIFIEGFKGSLPPPDTVKETGLESMYWRIHGWMPSLSVLGRSNFLLFFGAGGSFNADNIPILYNESLLIKVITSYGLLGSFLCLYLIRKLPIFFIIFILVTGITLDLFTSFKIFTISCLFLFIYFKNKSEIVK